MGDDTLIAPFLFFLPLPPKNHSTLVSQIYIILQLHPFRLVCSIDSFANPVNSQPVLEIIGRIDFPVHVGVQRRVEPRTEPSGRSVIPQPSRRIRRALIDENREAGSIAAGRAVGHAFVQAKACNHCLGQVDVDIGDLEQRVRRVELHSGIEISVGEIVRGPNDFVGESGRRCAILGIGSNDRQESHG